MKAPNYTALQRWNVQRQFMTASNEWVTLDDDFENSEAEEPEDDGDDGDDDEYTRLQRLLACEYEISRLRITQREHRFSLNLAWAIICLNAVIDIGFAVMHFVQ